jgi:BirA family biotin operon repressor/biotin-[acetyl-CoA-carboxylase] ligase
MPRSTVTPDFIPEDIAEALAAAGHRLGPFEGRLSWYDEVPSTNDLAAVMAESGAAEGSVVAANGQTSGRGRLGRSWASPPGAGLYVSAILRPAPGVVPLLTIAAGVAIADGVQAASGLSPRVKWPNDVYVGARKLAGILAEAGGSSGAVKHVILGFGINLLTAAYPADVAARATSIENELGRRCDRGLVLAECLAALADRYRALQRGEADTVTSAWRDRAADSLGRIVEWDADGATRCGVAQDIDSRGALLIRVDGAIVRVISGEVRWLP